MIYKFVHLFSSFQFHESESRRARSEYDRMILRQDLEAEELRASQEAALKELQQLQVYACFVFNILLHIASTFFVLRKTNV